MSPGQSAQLSLIFDEVTNPPPTTVPANYTAVVQAADKQHLSLLRIQGRTAYVSASIGAARQAPLQSQALVLAAFSAVGACSLAHIPNSRSSRGTTS